MPTAMMAELLVTLPALAAPRLGGPSVSKSLVTFVVLSVTGVSSEALRLYVVSCVRLVRLKLTLLSPDAAVCDVASVQVTSVDFLYCRYTGVPLAFVMATETLALVCVMESTVTAPSAAGVASVVNDSVTFVVPSVMGSVREARTW